MSLQLVIPNEPISRTAAQGPPLDDVCQTEVIELGSFTNYSALNGFSVEWDGQEALEFNQGCVPPAGYVALTQAWATTLGAIPEVAAEWTVTADGAFVTMTRKSSGPLTGFSITRTSGTAFSIESVVETIGVTGTAADKIGQECRYGDAPPYRWFKAATVSPATTWIETTPAVIENRDNSTVERLFVLDSTIQTELVD